MLRDSIAQFVLIGCLLFIFPFAIAAEHARQVAHLNGRRNR
ncbi:hypothetical protein V3589_11065 [Sinorhizobium fredii]